MWYDPYVITPFSPSLLSLPFSPGHISASMMSTSNNNNRRSSSASSPPRVDITSKNEQLTKDYYTLTHDTNRGYWNACQLAKSTAASSKSNVEERETKKEKEMGESRVAGSKRRTRGKTPAPNSVLAIEPLDPGSIIEDEALEVSGPGTTAIYVRKAGTN
ncbi:hypothetical protein [Oryza sativa Japonica Group]|uniref:Uncharacterized protein n=1 Tax=Oryza sativa subsp. japonica TaxID=39947 RepID=Q5NAD2_ORYSJ|nr:hypothetical protein [Oryza sativa Japonica Group]